MARITETPELLPFSQQGREFNKSTAIAQARRVGGDSARKGLTLSVGNGRAYRAQDTLAPVVLQSAAAVTTDFWRHQFPLTRMQEEWEEWYAGVYTDGLFPPEATMHNGLGQLQHVRYLALWPWFRMISDFHADGVLSEMPAPSGWDEAKDDSGGDDDMGDDMDAPGESAGDGGAALKWWTRNLPMMRTALRRAAHYWSIHNYAVITSEPGLMRAISPQYYYRVGLPEQRDADVGHILMLPYRDYGLAVEQQSQEQNEYNAIEIIKVPPRKDVDAGEGADVGGDDVDMSGQATSQHFEYHGHTIGKPRGPAKPTTIIGVYTFGEGHSWYPGAAPLIAEHMIASSMLNVELNAFANRPLILPAPAFAALRSSVAKDANIDVNDPASAESARMLLETEYKPTLAIDADDMGAGEIRDYSPQADRLLQLDMLAQAISIAGRLTKTAYGEGIGKGESGAAREKAEDAARIGMVRFREQMAANLPHMLVDMGAGTDVDKLGVDWTRPPLTSSDAYAESRVELFKAGLLTKNETRQALGLPPAPDDSGDSFDGDGDPPPMMMMNGGGKGNGMGNMPRQEEQGNGDRA